MDQPLKIGIIGDFDQNRKSHTATEEALNHAANALSVPLDVVWLFTRKLEDEFNPVSLKSYHALWCAPGSPYQSMSGALKAIHFAREQDWPFIGT
jgi:CTP synthase (UTP-ammonia lyase)